MSLLVNVLTLKVFITPGNKILRRDTAGSFEQAWDSSFVDYNTERG